MEFAEDQFRSNGASTPETEIGGKFLRLSLCFVAACRFLFALLGETFFVLIYVIHVGHLH